jgi:hypothetical protein
MTSTSRLVYSFLYVSLATVAGCGGSGGFATAPGESVLVDSATSFALVSSGGGLVAPRPQGAACDPGVWTYTVHVDTAAFEWDRCDVAGVGSEAADYTRATGSRTLSAAELDTAKSAARMVRVSGQSICGADKPTLHMAVASASGSIVYGDDFYSCTKQDVAYVESASLDNLHAVLRPLVLP